MNCVVQHLSSMKAPSQDSSCIAKITHELGGRIAILSFAILALAEAIARICFSFFARFAYLISCTQWERGLHISRGQSLHAQLLFSASFASLKCTILPSGLQQFIAILREIRVCRGEDLIQRKLASELQYATMQMEQEKDGPFRYLEGSVGTFASESVGEYQTGVCHFIGSRPTMEDEHLAVSFDLEIGDKIYPVRLFGVFDGHGGNEAALYLKAHLKDKLKKTLLEENESDLSDEGIWNALKRTFVRIDQKFKGSSGSTATVAMVLNGKLWTANVGDSRTILQNGSGTQQLSEDAEPGNPRYKKSIEKRGGVVENQDCPRVNGIAVGRAIGDPISNGALSARPKITMIPLTSIHPNSHLILSCDGIFDVASTRQIGQAVRDHAGESCETLAKNLAYSAFQAGSKDNLSALVIKLS